MTNADRRPTRHDLAWLVPRWRDALRSTLDPDDAGALVRWVARGLPTVVARRLPADADGVRLGVALPGEERRRVALVVGPEAIGRRAPPLELAAALQSAPVEWIRRLRALDADARDAGVVLRVYGSLAWQHLAGERRVTPTSDVDLLLSPRDGAQLRWALRAILQPCAGDVPALDGEVLLPGGRAVAWRELAATSRSVLVRTDDSVFLASRQATLGGAFRGAAC